MSADLTPDERATELGREAGRNAASWRFDGNTTEETYREFLRGSDEGDPLVLDNFAPGTGWLSGENADDPTPQTLAADLGIWDGHDIDAACTAYEDAADAAYWEELERVARLQTDED